MPGRLSASNCRETTSGPWAEGLRSLTVEPQARGSCPASRRPTLSGEQTLYFPQFGLSDPWGCLGRGHGPEGGRATTCPALISPSPLTAAPLPHGG